MLTLTIIVAIFLVGYFLLSAAILYGLSKSFKFENVSFAKASAVIAAALLTSVILRTVLGLAGLTGLAEIVGFAGAFFAFHWLLKKYSLVTWKKSLGVYTLLTISSVAAVLLFILVVRFGILEPFYMTGNAMAPTLQDRDYVILNKAVKNFKRGDIVIADLRERTEGHFRIARIVALPEETISVKENKVLVNNAELNEPYATGEIQTDIAEIKLNEDQFALLPDNRASAERDPLIITTANTFIGKAAFELENGSVKPIN